ncbi:hypothetical protein EBR25_12505 [bacterium]|nr:hypothetical protein [bacterium]
MEFDKDPTPLRARRQFEQALEGAEHPATASDTAQALELIESLLGQYPRCSRALIGTMDLIKNCAESIDTVRCGALTDAESLMDEALNEKERMDQASLALDLKSKDAETSQQLLQSLLKASLSFGNALHCAERSLQDLSNPRGVVRLTRIALYHYSKGVRQLLSELPRFNEDPSGE